LVSISRPSEASPPMAVADRGLAEHQLAMRLCRRSSLSKSTRMVCRAGRRRRCEGLDGRRLDGEGRCRCRHGEVRRAQPGEERLDVDVERGAGRGALDQHAQGVEGGEEDVDAGPIRRALPSRS
jgi:hypothetical protein